MQTRYVEEHALQLQGIVWLVAWFFGREGGMGAQPLAQLAPLLARPEVYVLCCVVLRLLPEVAHNGLVMQKSVLHIHYRMLNLHDFACICVMTLRLCGGRAHGHFCFFDTSLLPWVLPFATHWQPRACNQGCHESKENQWLNHGPRPQGQDRISYFMVHMRVAYKVAFAARRKGGLACHSKDWHLSKV